MPKYRLTEHHRVELTFFVDAKDEDEARKKVQEMDWDQASKEISQYYETDCEEISDYD